MAPRVVAGCRHYGMQMAGKVLPKMIIHRHLHPTTTPPHHNHHNHHTYSESSENNSPAVARDEDDEEEGGGDVYDDENDGTYGRGRKTFRVRSGDGRRVHNLGHNNSQQSEIELAHALAEVRRSVTTTDGHSNSNSNSNSTRTTTAVGEALPPPREVIARSAGAGAGAGADGEESRRLRTETMLLRELAAASREQASQLAVSLGKEQELRRWEQSQQHAFSASSSRGAVIDAWGPATPHQHLHPHHYPPQQVPPPQPQPQPQPSNPTLFQPHAPGASVTEMLQLQAKISALTTDLATEAAAHKASVAGFEIAHANAVSSATQQQQKIADAEIRQIREQLDAKMIALQQSEVRATAAGADVLHRF